MKIQLSILAIAGIFLAGAVSAATVYKTYTTKNNDTIAKIAAANATTTDAIKAMNDVNNLPLKTGTLINVGIKATTPTPPPTPVPPTTGEVTIKAYVTSYTYWDNTPPGSADIALPVLHSKAGGTGTYSDPITVAVGHVISGGKDTPDYPAGTKFYIPNLRRYFIVEDVCGDGNSPQNGPCHKGFPSNSTTWLDIWIDGASVTSSKATACANALTEVFTVIKNPASNYAVVAGSVIQNGACSAQYGNTLVTQ